MLESRIKRMKRYCRYMFDWIFKEKIRGLDFTMRDLHLIKETGGVFHGYSKTDEAHARMIFDTLGIDLNQKLLDVGCGKGAFLREAARQPFGKIAGIEIDKNLVRIAKKNFKILGLDKKVQIINSDALEFNHYDAFNIFYFFNPFDKEVMEQVADRIENSHMNQYYMILHNPTCAEVVETHGGKLINKLHDHVKSYETYIYKCGE